MIRSVYFDYAATTPLEPEIAQQMMRFQTECFGNPSSVHSFGRAAREAVNKARNQVAALLERSRLKSFLRAAGQKVITGRLRA